MTVTMENTYRHLSAAGILASPLCPCCCLCYYYEMLNPPLSVPHFVLTQEMLQVRPPPPLALIHSQCSHFDSSSHLVFLLQPCQRLRHSLPSPPRQLQLEVLHDWWGLRGLRGYSFPGSQAQSRGWSAETERGCRVLWSWYTGLRMVPGQILQTSPLGQRHPVSAVGSKDNEEKILKARMMTTNDLQCLIFG